jgi:hypothetical protein
MPVKSNKRRPKGSGSIILRGKKYYLETTIEGKRIQKALRTENKQEAQKRAKELLPNLQARTKEEITAKVAEARKLSTQNKVPINKTWELFYNSSLRKQSTSEGTLKNYQRNWKKFKSWLKSAFPAVVSLSHVDLNIASEYAKHLWGTGISANTYNYHIGALSTITKILMHSAGLDDNVWDHIARKHEQKQGKKRLYLDDMLKILEVFSDDGFNPMHKKELEILFHIGIFTGMRLVRVVRLPFFALC